MPSISIEGISINISIQHNDKKLLALEFPAEVLYVYIRHHEKY
jgi:hypothetical protein